MENSPELPSNIEVEEHHRTQVWIIDDNTDFNDALQRSLKYGEDRGVDFKFFNEGESALSAFEECCENKAQLPSIILVDYNLEQFAKINPRYKTGVEIIAKLEEICAKYQASRPEIIAYSSDKEQNEKLVQAGANSSIDKSDSRNIRNYLRGIGGQQ